MLNALKEIRKLAEISLCNAKDLVDYGFDAESVDENLEAVESIRDNLAKILKIACDTVKEEEEIK